MSDRELGVQALRGCAALSVLGFHLFSGLGAVGFWATDAGQAGVILFFVLSGYLLTKRWNSGAYPDLRAFYLRRVFRIWPLYLATLPLFIIACGMAPAWSDLAFLQDYNYRTFLQPNPTWTLCVEEAFYLFLPLWAPRFATRAAWPLAVGLLGVSVGWTIATVGLGGGDLPLAEDWLLKQPPTFLFAYALGSLAGAQRLRSLPKWAPIAPMIGIALLWPLSAPWAIVEPLTAIGCTIALLGWGGARWSSEAVGLGTLTYPIYLLGEPARRSVDSLLGVTPLAIGTTVALTLLGAWAAHRFLEAPAIRWGRRWERVYILPSLSLFKRETAEGRK